MMIFCVATVAALGLTPHPLRLSVLRPRLPPRQSLLATASFVPTFGEDQWWLDDPVARGREPPRGVRRDLALVAVVSSLCVASIVQLSLSGTLQWTASTADVATSQLAARWVLAVWRIVAAVGCSVLTVARCSVSSVGSFEDLDRRLLPFRTRGIWRFQGLTGWSWLLINAYFVLTAVITLAPTSPAPSLVAVLSQVMLGTAFAFALLVTAVVSFVLIPQRLAKAPANREFFRPQPLIMHNANVALMGTEICLSTLRVPLAQLPFALLFGIGYLAWHNTWRYRTTRTVLYFFLNWERDDALQVLVCLLALFGGCYTLGYAVSSHLRPHLAGRACLALALVAIMRVRAPRAVD